MGRRTADIMDKVTRALKQHRNTPDSEYGLSAAQLVFGRPIRDFLPIKPGQFSPSEVWMDTREKRELALRERFLKGAERWSRNTRDLKPLQIGQKVLIQNQHGAGKIAKKWDRTGQVVEDLGYNKYRVKVDGSGRVSDRNRQFLRQITPVTPSLPGPGPSPGPSCHDTAQSSVQPPVQPPPLRSPRRPQCRAPPQSQWTLSHSQRPPRLSPVSPSLFLMALL